MTSPPGIRYEAGSKPFRGLFSRWGITGGFARGLLNAVVPVSIVERFRDDDEGSLFGLTAETAGSPGEFSACAFGSIQNAWEIHAVNLSFAISPGTAPQIVREGAHIFTPIIGYNPVQNNPVGPWLPGLITNAAFTFGSVSGISGTNVVLPAIQGFSLFDVSTGVQSLSVVDTWVGNRGPTSAVPNTENWSRGVIQGSFRPDPPLRIQRDQTLAVQLTHLYLPAEPVPMAVSILYNEIRERVS